MPDWASTLLGSTPDYNAFMKTRNAAADRRTQMDAGQAAAAGDFNGAASAAYRGGDLQGGAALAGQDDQQKQRAVLAGARAAVQASQSPEAWAEFQKYHPGIPGWGQHEEFVQKAAGAINPQTYEAQRQAQSNADRTYNLAAGQAKTSHVPAGYRQTQDGNLELIPGGPASGGKTANAPPGYRWGGDGTTLEAIPGGPAEKLPAELAGRVGLAEEFLRQLPDLKKDIAAGAATGPIDYAAGKLGQGRSGEIHRRVASGVDALIRGLTGAGMGISEANQYVERYRPQITDNSEVLTDKVSQLEAELRSVMSVASRGRGTSGAPPAGAGPPPDPSTAGGYVQAGSKGNPIQVQTPEDAMRLPAGTVFTTPDGRTKIR